MANGYGSGAPGEAQAAAHGRDAEAAPPPPTETTKLGGAVAATAQTHKHSHSHSHAHSHAQHQHSHGQNKHNWVDLHFGIGEDLDEQGNREQLFTVCDGMTNNACLILGTCAATNLSVPIVVTAGIVGMLAGAVAMACGQWLAATLDEERERDDLEIEWKHLEQYPDQEDEELLLCLEKYGFLPDTMAAIKRDMQLGGHLARLRLHAKFELGLDPDKWFDEGEGGKAVWSELSSAEAAKQSARQAARVFLCYALGALIPLVPWLIPALTTRFPWISAALTCVLMLLSLAFTGHVCGRFVEGPQEQDANAHGARRLWKDAVRRQVGVGCSAAGFVVACAAVYAAAQQ